MAVDGIIEEEVSCLGCDISRTHTVAPFVEELVESTPRTQLIVFPQAAKYREFVVGETHVGLVGLHICFCDGLQLGSRDGGEKVI